MGGGRKRIKGNESVGYARLLSGRNGKLYFWLLNWRDFVWFPWYNKIHAKMSHYKNWCLYVTVVILHWVHEVVKENFLLRIILKVKYIIYICIYSFLAGKRGWTLVQTPERHNPFLWGLIVISLDTSCRHTFTTVQRSSRIVWGCVVYYNILLLLLLLHTLSLSLSLSLSFFSHSLFSLSVCICSQYAF